MQLPQTAAARVLCDVAAPERIQLGNGHTVRLQASQVSASTAGARRGDCSQDVADRGGSVAVEDQVERGSGTKPHQVTSPVDRLAAT